LTAAGTIALASSASWVSAPRTDRAFSRADANVEKAIIESGVHLLKYWLEVSMEEQERRLRARIDDGRKIWKLSPMDLRSFHHWYDYSRAGMRCLPRPTRPGALERGALRRQKRARLNMIAHLLSQIPTRRSSARPRNCRSGRSRTGMSIPSTPTDMSASMPGSDGGKL